MSGAPTVRTRCTTGPPPHTHPQGTRWRLRQGGWGRRQPFPCAPRPHPVAIPSLAPPLSRSSGARSSASASCTHSAHSWISLASGFGAAPPVTPLHPLRRVPVRPFPRQNAGRPDNRNTAHPPHAGGRSAEHCSHQPSHSRTGTPAAARQRARLFRDGQRARRFRD
jgi:hypothetical protein